jgi:hypothetical protein
MAFMNLYTKSTANPKDIDFATVGTRVKNKIPDAAIKAFQAKVPGPQAKPFDFTFDKDYDTGKLQIAVKKLGFVYGWVDATFAANKTKMKAVETEIEGWKTHIQQAIDGVAKHRTVLGQLAKQVEALEAAAASNAVDAATVKEVEAAKQGFEKFAHDASGEHAAVVQFLNSGPNEGVMGLLKKHGIPAEQLGGERKEADADFVLLQQAVKKFQEQFAALGQALAPLRKRCDDVGVKLFLLQNARRDRKSELEDLQIAIQKNIGEIQGYKNTDFAGVGAKALLNDAKEFTGKSGTTWVKLSANPGEIDKTVAHVQEVFERMRILGGRVVQEYQSWQKPAIPRGGDMPKYQQMLKMVYDEYMVDHNLLQNTLKAYRDALLKQKPKAVELAAKAAKATAKAEAKVSKVAKVAKVEAKAAKKGK